jgi:hypothetical protein
LWSARLDALTLQKRFGASRCSLALSMSGARREGMVRLRLLSSAGQ